MDGHDLLLSTLDDLQGVGVLFLRRQLSLTALRVNYAAGAGRMRLVDPEQAEVLQSFVDLFARIDGARPAQEQFTEVGHVLDRFEVYRSGLRAA